MSHSEEKEVRFRKTGGNPAEFRRREGSYFIYLKFIPVVATGLHLAKLRVSAEKTLYLYTGLNKHCLIPWQTQFTQQSWTHPVDLPRLVLQRQIRRLSRPLCTQTPPGAVKAGSIPPASTKREAKSKSSTDFGWGEITL